MENYNKYSSSINSINKCLNDNDFSRNSSTLENINHLEDNTNNINKDQKNFLINNDLFFCPNCLVDLSNHREYQEFKKIPDYKKILCKFCEKSFFSLKCYHCKRKHFFQEDNIIDGINIKCQYPDCGKCFSRSSCSECQKNLYYPDKFLEGTIVKCPFKECEQPFSKILCPNILCNTMINFKNGIYKKDIPYQEGILINCTNEKCKIKSFSKINCLHCSRRLVFIYPNNILEAQKIICPYEDCRFSFNKIYCPHCYKCNVYKKGLLEYGSKIVCIYKECRKSFNKIFCPHCFKSNIFLKGDYIEGIKTTCINKSCSKNFQMLTCITCKRINIWKNADYIIGQNIVCAYEDCKSNFSKISCPHCNRINIFSLGLNSFFTFGKTYVCIFNDCKKEFTNFICVNCKSGLNFSSSYQEGNKVICGVNGCRSSFYNFKCPYCYGIIFDSRAKYKFGQALKCPFEKCSKIFNYNFCFKCKKGIFHKHNDYKEGQIIICPYSNCKESFYSVFCTECEKNCLYNGDYVKIKDKFFECTYSFCKKIFEPNNIQDIIYDKGIKFIPEQGSAIKLEQPVKEENEVKIYEILYKSRKFYRLDFTNIINDQRPFNSDSIIPFKGKFIFFLFFLIK